MGPQKVAGTLHSETPLELGAEKGTIREISMRGFDDLYGVQKPRGVEISVITR